MIPFLAAALTLAPLPSMTGDFDHDGKPDAATLEKAGDRYRLVIHRGAAWAKPEVLLSIGNPAKFYLGKAQSGDFATACGKGLGAASGTRCAHAHVALTGKELAFGVREAADAVAIWKGDRFDIVWLTD